MSKLTDRRKKRQRRIGRIRAKINGTAECPRLSMFRSNKGMYLQLINDEQSVTLVSAASKEIKKKDAKKAVSFELGKLIAKKALEKSITRAVFDRGGYKYHGRVAKAAEGAREGGLKF